VLPALLALAEKGRFSYLAYHLAWRWNAKSQSYLARHYEDEFHSTGTCGPFGSAAACAKLFHSTVSKIRNTFWPGGQPVGGLRENFGTMTKPFQAGHAAESGFAFGRTYLARLDGGGANSGSGARVLPCFRRIVQSRAIMDRLGNRGRSPLLEFA